MGRRTLQKPVWEQEGWEGYNPHTSILRDPNLIAIDPDGSAVYADEIRRRVMGKKARPPIAGGMDGAFYRDLRQGSILTADLGSVTLATTQKMLWAPGATSPTILPANYWWPGKKVKLTCNLKWTAVANTNGITIGMAYGAADAPACNVVAAALTPVSGTSTFSVYIEGYAECRSIGTAGTLSMWGVAIVPAGLSTGGPANFPSAGVTVVSTIDTTVGTNGVYFQALRATTAGDTVLATNLVFEALN